MKNTKAVKLFTVVVKILLLTFVTEFVYAQTDAVGSVKLPTPQTIVANYVEALGGEEIIRSTSSFTATGKYILDEFGIEGKSTWSALAPNKIRFVQDMGPIGVYENTYNGELGWVSIPSGDFLMGWSNNLLFRHYGNYYAPLDYAQDYPQQDTVEATKFADEEVYKVELVDTDSNHWFHYFSIDTGLLIGVETVIATDGIMGKGTIMYQKYKKFGKVLIPTLLRFQGSDDDFYNDRTISDIEFDMVDEKLFDVPAVILELL